MNPEALAVALTPALVYVGAAAAYFGFTERGDLDPVPEVRRGETDWEPWGVPVHVKDHALPGSVVMQLPRDHALDGKTAEHMIIYDERTNNDEISRRGPAHGPTDR